MTYTNIPTKATLKPSKFTAHVSDKEIDKFKSLLQLSELGPKTYENTTNDKYYGVTYEWMENAKSHWLNDYDWRKTEAKINSYPNYTVDLQGQENETYQIHFIALFSDKKDAIPITFLHGWPGSFLEFLGFIDVMTARYPSAADLPYHIIVPSLPGYGYSSSASPLKDATVADQAFNIDKLMQGLGFGDGYVAQGGDIGSFLSRILVAQYPSCKAAHLNMCIVAPPEGVPDDAIDDFERKVLENTREFGRTGNAYAREHGTRPATIGFVLSASPLALLAWIAEKFEVWSDETPPLDDILDSVSLYWYTQSFPRCIFPYRHLDKCSHDNKALHIHAPKVFGFSSFPKDLGSTPKVWAETTGNLVWYKQQPSGGHFASMEKPKELWEDVEDFISKVWKGAAKL